MRGVRTQIGLVVAALLLLLAPAPAAAEDFQLLIIGQLTGEEPVKGGSRYWSDVSGDGTPTGAVVGTSTFILRRPLIQEPEVYLVDADGDELYLGGEGTFYSGTAFDGFAWIAGGTGKYATATGTFYFFGEDLGGGQYYVSYEGTIER